MEFCGRKVLKQAKKFTNREAFRRIFITGDRPWQERERNKEYRQRVKTETSKETRELAREKLSEFNCKMIWSLS